MPNTQPMKKTPEPEEVPPEARSTARGLKRWIQKRRERGVPPEGYQDADIAHCAQGCILHVHDE
jgi:hypothetical protein